MKFVPVVTAPALSLLGFKVARHFRIESIGSDTATKIIRAPVDDAGLTTILEIPPANTLSAAMFQARQTLLRLAELTSASQVA